MIDPSGDRPDPDAILHALNQERTKRARLKIFFGMCAGVGKTYEMLQAAQEAKEAGIDVVIGAVHTHGRIETGALVAGLPVIPLKQVEYRGTILEELDIDAILARKPALVLVDELAHTNAPGSRHTKRYLDVLELLDNGIDVFTTLNVQHLESRADTVAQITGTIVRETLPDSVFEEADEVEVIDIPPDELLRRLADGKVYAPERSQRAVENFFRRGNLTALREMTLRLATERVEHQLRDYVRTEHIRGPWRSGQRLVVGVTPSRESVHLIRWTKRLAFTMQASWVAVFVERSRALTAAAQEQFARNIELARELGAEVVTTADEDVAAALVRVAREHNATQIIVGRSGESRFMGLRPTLVDRIIGLSTDIDVCVTGGEEPEKPRRRVPFPSPAFHSGMWHYATAAAVVLLVSAACFPFAGVIGYQTISLILLLTVILLPLRFGVGPVVLAAALSALIWDFLFIPPRFTFYIRAPQDVLMVVMYFAVAAVTGILTVRVRAREKAVRSREERALALYALTNDLSSARNQNDVVQAAVAHVRKSFDADVAVFLSDLDGDFVHIPHPASTYRPSDKEMSVPSWVHWNEKRAGRFTQTLPFARATYYPLAGPRYPLGVLGLQLRGDARLSIDQESLLSNFLNQIASALEREFLNEMTKQSIALAESERLYTTLFNSISHEMRTPITALIAASEGLLDEAGTGSPDLRNRLAQEIQSAAERLDNIVQNLLAMTRLESGLIQPKRDWADLRDLINSATEKLTKELAGHRVTVDIAPTLPLVRVDFALMEQVFLNLVRNAAVHTPPGSSIEIAAAREGAECVVTISDNGRGFPPDALPRVFEKFYRVPGSKTGGIGLGLSIALGFVRAHRGTMTVENRPEGGARFTLRLPLETHAQPPAESTP
jgi:two-component system sensor histidine kinase KdpD